MENDEKRIIPGPAGIVQQALRRRDKGKAPADDESSSLTTQQFIEKELNKDPRSDTWMEAFASPLWVSANNYFDPADEFFFYDPPWTIKYISGKKQCAFKIAKMILMVDKLTPNGFGDYMAQMKVLHSKLFNNLYNMYIQYILTNSIRTWKDTTGVISASIHRTVMAEVVNAKNLHVGAVMILKNVSQFRPKNIQYINITPNNVVSVFSNDPPSTNTVPLSEDS